MGSSLDWGFDGVNQVLIPSVRSMNYILRNPGKCPGLGFVLIPSVRSMNYIKRSRKHIYVCRRKVLIPSVRSMNYIVILKEFFFMSNVLF